MDRGEDGRALNLLTNHIQTPSTMLTNNSTALLSDCPSTVGRVLPECRRGCGHRH